MSGTTDYKASGSRGGGLAGLFPRFPERISVEFYRISGKLRFVVVTLIIGFNGLALLGVDQMGFDPDVFWPLFGFHAVTHVAVAIIAFWMWKGAMSKPGLRRATYACMFIETTTTLITMWVYGTVSSHMIIFAVVFVLIYRLAFDFRIGITAFATLLLGQWAIVIAETSGWLPAQPISPGQIDLVYQSAQREISSMFVISVLLGLTFAAANWAVARMRYKEIAIRMLRESLQATQQGKLGRHTGKTLKETYVVSTVLGAGAMGEVYAGHHRRTKRKLAIKMLHPHLVEDQEVLKRFRREAEITGRLGSQHIVEIIDMDEEDGQPFIVLELLDGDSLGERIERDGPMNWEVLDEIVRQLARGLEAAHDAGVVHRDLKPANVILTRRDDGELLAKILDFGVSKIRGNATAITQEVAILGTPDFMSPEQAVGIAEDVDERTDIFALGAMIYNAIAGQRPFVASSVPALLRRICDEEPLPLEELRPNMPKGVVDVVSIAMAKDPAQRYATAGDLARDFSAAIAGHLDEEVISRAAAIVRGRPATRTIGGTVADANKLAMADTSAGS